MTSTPITLRDVCESLSHHLTEDGVAHYLSQWNDFWQARPIDLCVVGLHTDQRERRSDHGYGLIELLVAAVLLLILIWVIFALIPNR